VLTNALPPQQWTLFLAAGSSADLTFTFTTADPGGITPYPISGATWEYVVRPTATSTGTPLISVTTSLTAAGLITVTSTSSVSQVLLALYPAATAALAPGAYAHALWMNPASSTTAFTWASGVLTITGNPQP
jgi:hypothetical protein